MSIGQNAIKRVENNGYSRVETSAPDMENSTVAAGEPIKTEPVKAEPAKKPRTNAAKRTPPCAPEGAREGFVRYSFGEELPYWLL